MFDPEKLHGYQLQLEFLEFVPGIPHHITQRGNRRQQTFFCADPIHPWLRTTLDSRLRCEKNSCHVTFEVSLGRG